MPIALIALIVPPFITEGNRFAENLPKYSRQVTRYVEDNDRLRELNNDYDITEKLQDEADKLPSKLGGAATTLRDVGIAVVNSLFALLTILVLTAFMLGSGRTWVDAALRLRPPEQRLRLERSIDRIANAVGGYVAGAIFIAFIAGVATYVMLTILGVPFRAPLAVIAGLFSLIPLVGATIAAVLIGVVTLFEDFPTATIIWVIWAIVYQQFENHVIQPQVQKRTVNVHPFVTIVSVLIGSTLLGDAGRAARDPDRGVDPDPAARVLRPAHALPAPGTAAGGAAATGAGGRAGPCLAFGCVCCSDSPSRRAARRSRRCRSTCSRRRSSNVLGRVGPARRREPALVRGDAPAPGRQLRLHVGGPAARAAHQALGSGDHLAARLERVRAGRARRRGRVGRDAVRDAHARRHPGGARRRRA